MRKWDYVLPLLQNVPPKEEERVIIEKINDMTAHHNKDNISRTKAYEAFFYLHPEIRWSFLASMVSRNAGWNMTDLESPIFCKLLPKRKRIELFQTYEKANWTIFSDAFPQLLVYHYSTLCRQKKFHFLRNFFVSEFMISEWEVYWERKLNNRLLYSLIVNEQNIIEEPLIKHPAYKRNVFKTPVYRLQELLHLSSVIFPTRDGELFGGSVVNFTKLQERVQFGKKLALLLFEPVHFEKFLDFSLHQDHTGSRTDYEKYLSKKPLYTTPWLRLSYPIISHHVHEKEDWSQKRGPTPGWEKSVAPFKQPNLTEWFFYQRKKLEWFKRIWEFLHG
ncbi:DUF2515 family protein [Bacillus spongiae]|uniref:DUF2515 family protein n=1 Tax=Bacillus spongiae TaxID=2683610 RepID=A0ABU8HD63_9BACI